MATRSKDSVQKSLDSAVLLLAAMLFGSGGDCLGDSSRTARPNAVDIELLGRAFVWSLGYTHSFSDRWSLGLSIGLNPSGSSFPDGLHLPLYVNYYFSADPNAFFGTAGITRVSGYYDPQWLPQIGAGYETRWESGFLFRVTLYASNRYHGDFIPWLGLSFGRAF